MRSLRSGRAVGAALALVLVILVTGSASAAELTPVEKCTRDGFPVTPTAFGKSRGSRFTTVAGWVFLDGSTPVVGARVEIVSRGRPLRLRARTSTRTGPGGAFLVAVPKLPAGAQLIARGGRVRGKAFRGTLRATLGGYTPGASLYVNPASTLVTAYLSAFPRRTPARAAAAVRRFLGLPSGTNITVDLQSSSSVFSASTFLAQSRGNVNGLLIRLARALREGKVRRFQGARGLPAAPTLRSDSVADDLTIWFVKQLANGAVSKLGGSGMGWVMSQYGIEDGIEGQVRRLSQQLERIDQQLTALSTQVRVLIAKVNELYLANLAKDLDDARSLIKSRMDDLMWVANMSGETPPPDRKELEQETCEKLRLLRPLAEGTTSFGYAELKINGAFFPQGSGSKSLTEAGSLVVGDKYGHWWTLGASAEMRALVDYWTAVQADWLALRLEWDHAAKPCTMANPTVNSCEALRWTTRYLSDSAAETDSAPVLEPSNTWIDRATGLMWAPASYDPMRDWQLPRSGSMRSVFGDPQRGPGWNVWYNSSLPTNCTDYAVVICAIEGKGRNGSQFGGFTDWGAPTEPQITALVAGYKIKPYYRPYDLLIGRPPFGPGLPRAWLEGMGTPRVLTKTCKTSSDIRDLPRWECVIDYLGEERAPYENVNITAAGYLLVRKPARVSDYTDARLSGGPYRYVATNGNDTNNTCTSYVLPCKTLARALDQANSGDVIRLGGGTFTGGVTVSKSVTISGNGAGLTMISGGGPVVRVKAGATVAIDDLTITGGRATAAETGGGIENGGTLTLTDSAVTASQAPDGGGIRNGDGGTLRIVGSTITGNSGDIGGIENRAAVSATPASLTMINSTVSANTGGGIVSATGNPVSLFNVTITANTPSPGNTFGALAANPATLTNTLVAANPGLADCYGVLTAGPRGHNLIGAVGSDCRFGAGTSAGNLLGSPSSPLDPKLGPLTGNGGPTKTNALLEGSPAIGAGDAAACADPGTVAGIDQRGYRRQRGSCDIGAYDSKAVNTP